MANSIASLLRNLGWVDGFRIPVADERNKILEVKVAELIRQKAETTALLTNLQYTVNEMKKFKDNIHERRMENQNILDVYRKQLDSEQRSFTDAQCELEKLNGDFKDAKKYRENALERKIKLLAEVEKSTEQMEKLQKNIDWCQELRYFWNKCVTDQLGDINIIETYKLQDDKRFEQLELKRVRLSSEVGKCKMLLDETSNEKRILESEREHMTKVSKKLRKERKQLMDQCESAIKILSRRDDDIRKKAQEINILKEVIRNKESSSLQQNDFWKEQTRDNMEIQIRLNQMIRNVNDQENENSKLRNRLQQSMDALAEMRLNVFKLESELAKERNQLKTTLNEIEQKKQQKQTLTKKNSELKENLKDAEHKHMSTSIRAQKLQQMYQEQEKSAIKLERDCKNKKLRIQDTKSKLDNWIRELEKAEADIKYCTNVARGLDDDVAQIKIEIEKENDLCQKLECQIKEAESKIAYAKGEKPDEEKIKLEEELKKLTTDLENRTNDHKATLEQIKQNEAQIKLLNANTKKNAEKIHKGEETLNELRILTENDQKTLDRLKENYQNQQMEENMLRVQVEKLRENFDREADEVRTLQKQQIEMEAADRERKEEITVAKNVLTMRKRALLKEHSNIKKNHECLTLHIGQLMKKHEVIIDSIGKDEDGQPISLTNYRIMMIHERAQLLEKGDELDSNIKKAEKEIQAMENTRRLVDVVNQNYKQQCSHPDVFADKRQEITALGKELQDLLTTLKRKKEMLKTIEFTYQELSESDVQLKSELEKLKEMEREKSEENCRLNQNVDQQARKITKLDQQLKLLMKSKKSWKTKLGPNLIMRDIDIRMLQDVNKRALQQLGELVTSHAEMVPVVKRYLAEKHISLPAAVYRVKSSARSSISSSSSSSRCSSGMYDAGSRLSDGIAAIASVVNIDSSVL